MYFTFLYLLTSSKKKKKILLSEDRFIEHKFSKRIPNPYHAYFILFLSLFFRNSANINKNGCSLTAVRWPIFN